MRYQEKKEQKKEMNKQNEEGEGKSAGSSVEKENKPEHRYQLHGKKSPDFSDEIPVPYPRFYSRREWSFPTTDIN